MAYFTTSDNCKLYYEEHGKGKAVVFIHGWSCNRHYFKKQLPVFRDRCQVLSYDLRGHGDSERPEHGLTLARFAMDLKELIEDRQLKDVTLIGWSMGVHIIYEYISLFGCANLHKVVLIDMTAKMVTDENWDHGLFGDYPLQAGVKYLEEIAEYWDGVAECFVPAMFRDGYPHLEEIEWTLKQAKKNTMHVMMSMWLAIIQKDYRDMLPSIVIPALITYGTAKSLYTPENSVWLKEHIKGSQLEGFNGGHIHFLEDAEAFNKKVMEFIGLA
jgi:pimeloyl-ACP methyl ester carboxylesterase